MVLEVKPLLSMYLQGISKYTANNSYLSGTNPMIDFDFSAVVPPPTNQNLHHALYKVKKIYCRYRKKILGTYACSILILP